ncbi:GNAT family N-acetyltransferase [Defluviimonas sp. D31]|uniref:GNAT family N-acetyltransferase n=1 Tax=Defluviimonas sp. D31 TaxID=3083253 RepID=UPI0029700064|nr:GNAT family N-acetyltransferase [Defluviimonas sp. D31]MDW4548853.1 GNAT family N-acetyltransferase [Defluviimonas sp. D31]
MRSTTYEVRDASPGDESEWRGLWQRYLDGYGVELAPEVTDFTWARLLDPSSPLTARLAINRGRVAGFAIHQHHPSTWVMGDDCYLEDLFVAESERERGVATLLINDLIGLAQARGWRRLYWQTDAANTRARSLYDRFVQSDGHIRYRIQL